MNISTRAIVTNSEIIKNFKTCREKAENFGKVFILKNNQPDAVLFSVYEYERLSGLIEYIESLNRKDFKRIFSYQPKKGINESDTMRYLKRNLRRIEALE